MLQPVFELLGPVGVALLFVVLVAVALAPGAWDVVGRVVPSAVARRRALASARQKARAWVAVGRSRLREVVAAGRQRAALSWPWG